MKNIALSLSSQLKLFGNERINFNLNQFEATEKLASIDLLKLAINDKKDCFALYINGNFIGPFKESYYSTDSFIECTKGFESLISAVVGMPYCLCAWRTNNFFMYSFVGESNTNKGEIIQLFSRCWYAVLLMCMAYQQLFLSTILLVKATPTKAKICTYFFRSKYSYRYCISNFGNFKG